MNNSMTKEEAEKKWCPNCRITIAPSGDVHFNDWGSLPGGCISSNCAVWKWDYKSNAVGPLPESEWRGHCGLIRQ